LIFYEILDGIVAAGRLPSEPEGCNCSRCITTASFVSDPNYNDWSVYKYQQLNTFQMGLILNDICLNAVNLTFYYTPSNFDLIKYGILILNLVNLTVDKIQPNNGTVDGGTFVNITMSGYNISNWCQFGNDGLVVPARLVKPVRIFY
jgi:hypothetical protein